LFDLDSVTLVVHGPSKVKRRL